MAEERQRSKEESSAFQLLLGLVSNSTAGHSTP
jgi:hypothetical protein